jgi:integrase
MGSRKDRRLKLYRGKWCVVWRENGQTKRASLHTGDRELADRRFIEYTRQVNNQAYTINEILDLWVEEKQNLKSIETAKRKLKQIRNFFGHYCPNHINRSLCREYKRKRSVSNTTVKNELSLLRAAVNWHNPKNEAVFEIPSPNPPKDHYLTPEDYNKLLNAATSPHIHLFIIIGFHTGARSNAILELTWDQIDIEREVINLAKGEHGNKRRALVPINETLRGYLLEAKRASTIDFVIEYGGESLKSIRKGFGSTAKRAGVKASPHILRHTAAVVLAESGRPMSEIAQYLGHAGQTTTEKVYARYSPTYLREAADVLHDWHTRARGSN